jgi:hypothetical protein
MKPSITLNQLVGLEKFSCPEPRLDQIVITKLDGRVRTQFRNHDCTHRHIDIINYNKTTLENDSDVICPLCDKFFSQPQNPE